MKDPIQELADALTIAIRNLTTYIVSAVDEEDLGLTHTQLGLLQCLSENDDPVQSVMAEQMGIDKSAILRQVDVMEDNQWLSRKVDSKDRRRKHLVLSKTGKTVLAKALKVRHAAFKSTAVGIADRDIEICAKVIRQLAENADRAMKKGQ